jgi:hypothetical protein
MSFTSPAHHIDRISVVGAEAEFVKMFDPPTFSPNPTPELVDVTTLPSFPCNYNPATRIITPNPRANPVPEVMEALGFGSPATPHTLDLDLLNGLDIVTWDNRPLPLHFMTIRDVDFGAGGTYPGPTIRVPRGVVFHCDTSGKGPPPHTIHWHGIEPSPMNDGVGHCSMEIGKYVYQLQPNFIGSYFYHCHRNTVQHFEFGLYGFLVVEPPDAYFASIASVNPDGTVNLTSSIPIGACSDGRFRTAANILTLPADIQAKFPGFVAGDATYGVAGPGDVGVNHPHAFTVPYDVEVIWVADDRDSTWSDLASDARATFPVHGAIPGVNDNFLANFLPPPAPPPGDYWFITGVPVPTPPGGTAQIPPNITIPAQANSGKIGTQVSVNAQVGDTILLRCLDGAYNNLRVTLPVDAVIIAWDGRPLGVPPFGGYNHAFVVPKDTPMTISVARRFDALIKAEAPTLSNTFAKVEFLETRGNAVTATALIPFRID